ncbi:MAG: NADH dehydrogenase [Candidatus Rokubacteria bacterium RIFCSPHIGHO2_12_FULL_73_22]|nr:MAG: NADH dehydrogenase [Candidatus Rokubacteria bacterium RIFCSPHIGHO2_12_FULL_73_22]OGL02395.1 MAG: NADH dehydrogenase [Candidatus Rokubacteria bacterium RIFCSPHIGHO2_02_FULL_73_26]OGL11156.1 MAG: NADH dehydrogenase [Candidatus Rokubacteria bacterium RIFCSPLOWO2_02_FULL_73_56]OGL21268.1 MAG: NADH dehydrogenase [Candidatus Rokubacteria bacterium RIFCSPLOWO2_12_FULL_73_47]
MTGLLSAVTFLPAAGALALLLVPRRMAGAQRVGALLIALAALALSLPLFLGFDADAAGYQFEEVRRWMPTLGVTYHVGIDGISLLLVLLTTFLTPLVLASAWHSIEDRVKEFVVTMLILETGMVGVFVSLDLFLFYVFWEAMLIPMYFVIGVWGGANRIYAAVKFVLYTMAGSVLMLVAILALYFQHGAATGTYTFDVPALARWVLAPGLAQNLMFLAFAFAFAIKVPLFPFHTWLPDAHVEAPTPGSVILAGVLLKMGTYGFLRFCLPFFPDASLAFGPLVFALAVIGIVYGAWVSTVQADIKKLVAYSSVSHLGFVMLGIFTLTQQGLVGGVIQMVNHGLSTGALFLMVGMIYERRHTRLIAEFGGLWKVVPAFSALFLVVTLSSVGLPGLNGFVGEFLILVGAFQVNRWLAAAATTGIIFAAVYMLWMYQRVIFGEVTHEANRGLRDLTPREWAVLVPVIVFIVWIGVYPAAFTGKTEASVEALIAQVQGKASPRSP